MPLRTPRAQRPPRTTQAGRRARSVLVGATAALALTLGVAGALTSATATATATATSGPDRPGDPKPPVPERHRVLVRDLPGVRAVAGIYPFLSGGSRSVYRSRDLTIRTGVCTTYRNGARAASGRWADYQMPGERTPFFEGEDSPVVFVHRFRSLTAARTATRQAFRAVRRCQGTHRDRAGLWVRSEEVDVMPLADQTLAHRVELSTPLPDEPRATDQFATIWLRQGRDVVEVRAQHDVRPPDLDRLTSLARLSLEQLDAEQPD